MNGNVNITAFTSPDEAVREVIRGLVNECRAYDGMWGEPMLSNEFNAVPEMKSFFLAGDAAHPDGVLFVYADERDNAEISAYVRPAIRRRGIFTELRKAALAELETFGYVHVLYKTEDCFSGGSALMRALSCEFSRSEYLMLYSGSGTDADASVREACDGDRERTVDVLCSAFGDSRELSGNYYDKTVLDPNMAVYVIEDGCETVGTCSADMTGEAIFLFGLCIAPEKQGEGFGKRLLSGVAADLCRRFPHKKTTLTVNSENAVARRLYESGGFSAVTRLDYYGGLVCRD